MITNVITYNQQITQNHETKENEMKKEITIIDLRNGDVFIKFGEDYAHTYWKGDANQIMDDINGFIDEPDTESWDNNEIENWASCYESDTTDLLTLEELRSELDTFNNKE